MVMSAGRGSVPPDPVAAARDGGRPRLPESSSFPVLKTWGSKRLLRCVNVNGRGEVISGGRRSVGLGCQGPDARRPPVRDQDEEEGEAEGEELEGVGPKLIERRPRGPEGKDEAEGEGDDGALEEVRAKLMVHLREAADRVQLAVGRKPEGEAETEAGPAYSSAAADATMPWNLRTRTGVRKVVRYGFESEGVVERGGPAKSARPRPWDAASSSERPRFSISLSTEEIAEDIYAVTGSLPRRRPRKRARAIQKQLDALFPGSWLTEITADSYNVPD